MSKPIDRNPFGISTKVIYSPTENEYVYDDIGYDNSFITTLEINLNAIASPIKGEKILLERNKDYIALSNLLNITTARAEDLIKTTKGNIEKIMLFIGDGVSGITNQNMLSKAMTRYNDFLEDFNRYGIVSGDFSKNADIISTLFKDNFNLSEAETEDTIYVLGQFAQSQEYPNKGMITPDLIDMIKQIAIACSVDHSV